MSRRLLLLPVSPHVRALSARRALSCPFAPTTPRRSPRSLPETPPRPPSLARRVSPCSGGLGHANLLDFSALPMAQPTSRVSFRFVSGRKPPGLRPGPPSPSHPSSLSSHFSSLRKTSLSARHRVYALWKAGQLRIFSGVR